MFRSSHHQESWNEFQWEREIRRDEKRISRYFRELPHCLDLPNEEEAIMNRLMAHPDLVPAETGWRNTEIIDFFFDDEDDVFDATELRRRKGSDLLFDSTKLAKEWNVFISAEDSDQLFKSGLAVTCLFGRLLSRCADVLEIEEQRMSGLKLGLYKRMLADINEIAGVMIKLKNSCPDIVIKLDVFIGYLHHIREKVVDYMNEIRSAG